MHKKTDISVTLIFNCRIHRNIQITECVKTI